MSNTNTGKVAKNIVMGVLVAGILIGSYLLVKNVTKKERYPKVKMIPVVDPITEYTIDGITYTVPDGYTIVRTDNGICGYGKKVIITEININEDLMDDNAYIIGNETYHVYPVMIEPEIKEKESELVKSE